MAELKHGSLLFSIGTYIARQREREALHRAEAERRDAIEQAERAGAERERLERELLRYRSQESFQRLARQHLEAEAQRLERLRRAELARALSEARARAELELEAERRRHEQKLSAIRLSTTRFKERVIAASLALLLASVALSFTLFYFARYQPEIEETRASFERLLATERARSAATKRLLDESRARERALRERLEQPQNAAGP